MDARDAEKANGKWYKSFNCRTMKLSFVHYAYDEEVNLDYEEEIYVPCKWEVCSLCNGKGNHVNPSIDANGITASEFAEDPDFAESYYRGNYDVSCYRCNGRTTEPVVDLDLCSEREKILYEEKMQEIYDLARERAYQQRYQF